MKVVQGSIRASSFLHSKCYAICLQIISHYGFFWWKKRTIEIFSIVFLSSIKKKKKKRKI